MQLLTSMAPFLETAAKLPQQKIAKAIGIVLLVYIAFLCAQITWMIMAPSNAVNPSFAPTSKKASSGQTKRLSIQEILTLNLFGFYQENPEAEVEEVIQDAPETRLNLTLSATVASSDKNIAAAIIEKSGKQETYGIGENIVGTRATLEQVLTDRVIIKQSGRMETLMLDGFDYSKTQARSSTRKVVASRNVPRPSTRKLTDVSPRPQKIVDQRKNSKLSRQAKKLKQDLATDPGKITDYLKISPKRKDGKIIGYLLRPGKDPEFFKSSGLKSGDVAVQMNGYDLKEPREAAQALAALKQERDVSIMILRNEELTEVLFSIEN